MAGATLSNTLDLLKDKFTRRIRSQTHDRTILWASFPKGDMLFDGSQIVGLLATGYPATGGGRGPGATLPVSGYTALKRYQVRHAYLYYVIAVDWDLQEQSKGPASWVRGFLLQMDRVRKFMSKDIDRMASGNGSGKLGTVSSASNDGTNTTITLKGTSAKFDAVNFEIGMLLTFYDATDEDAAVSISPEPGESTNIAQVLAVNPGGPTVKVTGVHAPTDGDIITKYAARTAGAGTTSGGAGTGRTREVVGIDGVVSDSFPPLRQDVANTAASYGTFQGIDPSTDTFWKCQKVSAGTSPDIYLNSNLIQAGLIAVEVFGADATDTINTIWAHPTQIRKYAEGLRDGYLNAGSAPAGDYSNVRFVVREPNQVPPIGGGYPGAAKERVYMAYAGIPIKGCRYLRRDRAYMINSDSIRKYILSDFHFVPGEGGGIIHKDYTGRAAYQAEALGYMQCGTEVRNSSVLLDGLSESGLG